MLGTKAELRKTRFYQEIQEEIFVRVIPTLLEAGMSISEIAKELGISVKRARAIAKSSGTEV
jgi:predicted transposase YdaD